MEPKAIKTVSYLEVDEITKHLSGVEYILMASPAPDYFEVTPLHFTIFLNTTQSFPEDIEDAILNKFLKENGITTPVELMAQIMPVGFSLGVQETPMPMLLVKEQDMRTIPNQPMFVFDFLADSANFNEVKIKNLTGWSYSYDN